MKTINDKKFLVFFIVSMLVLSTIFGAFTINNYKKANYIDKKIQALQEKTKIPENKAIRLQSYKKEIAEYENRIAQSKNDYDSLNNGVENTVKRFCDIMTYKTTRENKKTIAASLKSELLTCVTKDCLDNQISNLFVFKDSEGYYAERKLTSVAYSDYNKNNPHILAVISYRTRAIAGTEYCDCIMTYDNSVKAYYISDMKLIKNEIQR